ncbi:MAG: anti-sigma factor family protein [Bacillota bacterium]
MIMKCSDDLLQLYVENELHPAERAILDEHLKGCAACRRRVGFYKGLFWDLGHAPRAEVDAGSPEALAALLRAEWERGRSAERPSTLGLATLWLTANPAARAVGGAGKAGLSTLGQAGKAGLSRLFRRKGGGSR